MTTTLLGLLKLGLRNPERVLLLITVVALLWMTKLYNGEKEARRQSDIAIHGLADDEIARYKVENTRLTQAVRDAEGNVRIVTRYIPSEGSVTVVTKKRDEAIEKYKETLEKLKNAPTPKAMEELTKKLKKLQIEIEKPPDIFIRDKGFTSRFGAGFVITPGASMKFERDGRSINLPLVPSLDWKWGFWRRFSATLNLNPLFLGPCATRHIDDFTPGWMHVENLEAQGCVGPLFGQGWPTGSGWQAGIGLRSNF